MVLSFIKMERRNRFEDIGEFFFEYIKCEMFGEIVLKILWV